MSITFIGSTTSATANLFDACNRTSEIVTVSRATPDRIETWNVSSLAAGVSINLQNNSQVTTVCMISNASACAFTQTTNMDIVDLDTNYRTNHTGVVATRTSTKGQQSAALPDYNVAISTTNTANTVNRFNSSTFTAGTQVITGLNGFNPLTIIALASSFLIGTDGGGIVEISPTFSVVKSYQIPQQLDRTTLDRNYVTGLSYYNGIVLANTSIGRIYQIDWMTLDLLNVMPFAVGTTIPQGPSLCTTASGVSLAGVFNGGTSNKPYNAVSMVDYRVTPPKIDDTLFLNTAQNIIQTGIQSGIGWAIYQTNTIINFNLAPIYMSTQNPVIIYDTQYQQGQRISIIDDGTTRVESDIVIPSSADTSYTITPGTTVIDIAFLDTGVNKLGSVSRYNT